MKKSKAKVLVTGGAGFIGSHVAQELLTLGYSVVVLDDLSGGFRKNIPIDAEFVQGDVNDTALLSEIFEKHQFEYVFHLAAYAAEGLSHFIKRFNYTNNLVGSVGLINESVKHAVKCFVFTSSIAVYGSNQLPMTEDLAPQPEDSYGIAKLAVEQELKISHEIFGLKYIIFRPHNVYGEHQNIGDKYRNVIGIFINNVMKGDSLVIFGDGQQTRGFSYIADVAPIIARSIENPSCYQEIFNIGADKPYTINELAQTVIEAMGRNVPIVHAQARQEVKHAYADHQKLKKFFGQNSTVSLKDGVGKMVQWAKSTGIRHSQEFSNIEISKNLPTVWLKKDQGAKNIAQKALRYLGCLFMMICGSIFLGHWVATRHEGLNTTFFLGEHFDRKVHAGTSRSIDFDNYNDFNPMLPAEHFSAKWNGFLIAPVGGQYSFNVEVDDGVRVWIDGKVLFDEWRIQSSQFSKTAYLNQGKHDLRIEYYQYNGGSHLKLYWQPPGGQKQIIPPEYLRT